MPPTPSEPIAALFGVLCASLLAAQTPSRTADAEADRLLRQRDFAAAIRHLDACIAADARNANLYCQRAYAKGASGDHAGGLRDADKAIELDAKNARGWLERGYLKHATGRSREAIPDLDRAIELAPENPHAHGDRGDARQALDEFEQAIADYDQALRLHPAFGEALYNRGRCRRMLGQLLLARGDFRRAARLLTPPLQPQFWYECACIEADLGMWRTALDSAAKAIELAPEDWSLRAQRGRLAWRGGMAERGLDDLQAAATQDRDPAVAADALLSLGCIRLCRGETQSAVDAFGQAEQHATFAPWAVLMRWCAERRSNAAAADASLAAASTGTELSEQLLELMALCSRGEGDSADLPLTGRASGDACPLLFFSGWRAETSGKRDEALRKFVRCVNTGRNEWMQWQVAADHVRRWTAHAPLRVGFGVELAPEADDRGVRVRRVVEGLAADLQGLQVDDTIVACNHVPATIESWSEMCAKLQVGLPVKLSVRRAGVSKQLRVFAGLEPQ